jgi:hypothetical protein
MNSLKILEIQLLVLAKAKALGNEIKVIEARSITPSPAAIARNGALAFGYRKFRLWSGRMLRISV